MANTVHQSFALGLEQVRTTLSTVSEELADVPWRPGGWTRRQILGHMLDSATNNHQRFVRASLDGAYSGPTYDQQAWVDAHGYAEQSWSTLLTWWSALHQILEAVVARIPEDSLETVCFVEGDPPTTLRFRIEDYITHLQHHLTQITATASAS
jgi:hypothetical protein